MLKFRQPIRPGDRGRDIRAVKRTLLRLHAPGSGAMGKSGFSGTAFVKTLKTFQRHHALHADGVYGKASHAKLAPHFDAYSQLLYRTARLRHQPTPVVNMEAQDAAKRILEFHGAGKYVADNPRDLDDIKRTAEGLPVWSQRGYWVHVDKRVMELLVWLIENGYGPVGTMAICSDHHDDGPHGHAGGKAVDISRVKGTAIASSRARTVTLELVEALHTKRPAQLAPWQLICDGYGYQHDRAISALTIPSAGFYGYQTMAAHRNHAHFGVYT